MGGRPRVPTKLKKMKGTYRPSRSIPNEMNAGPLTVTDPPWPLNEWGNQEWERIVGQFKDLLTELDVTALWVMCNEFGRYMEAEELAKDAGRKSNGNYLNVHDRMSAAAFSRYKDMIVQFGLTPASRTKISQPEKKEDASARLLAAI